MLHQSTKRYAKMTSFLQDLISYRSWLQILRFREGQIALTADFEPMFRQLQVPERDRNCLRFLWRPRDNKPVGIYEYQCHILVAESSLICANYTLMRVGLDSEEECPNAAKSKQNNFCLDHFIKSVKIFEESIEVFNQLQPLHSQHGFPGRNG